jgi:hypothetical protein
MMKKPMRCNTNTKSICITEDGTLYLCCAFQEERMKEACKELASLSLIG